MIELFKFPGSENLESTSPFCLRVELYLKLNNIPYSKKILFNPNKAPKGKLPYITHDNNTISDSSFILDYLETKFPIIIEHSLDIKQRSLGHALEVMCNEHLYWALVYLRWISKENYSETRDKFFSSVPRIGRGVVFSVVQKKIKDQLLGHGFGKHSQKEIEELTISDITALSNILDDQAYFFGDKITRYDITIYSFLANFLYSGLKSNIVNKIKTHDNLIRFTERIKKAAFPS